jgi:predicted ATPase
LEEATLRYQVLVSTHSPDLIDHLPVDSFLIVEKENDVTKIGPLMSNQRSSIEKKLFSAGEIMQMEGLQREEREGCQP